MTVKELIAKLEKLPEDMVVIADTDYGYVTVDEVVELKGVKQLDFAAGWTAPEGRVCMIC